MAYANFDDVLIRAGRYGSALTVDGRRPNQADVAELLDDTAAEIDAALEARGIEPENLDARAAAGLKDLNAYGALSRALAAMPGDKEQDKLLEYARKLWGAALGDPTSNTAAGQAGSIAEGTHPVVRNIEAGMAGVEGAGAGSYWDELPGVEEDPDLAPFFTRTQFT